MEFLKNKINRGLASDLYFYRDSNGVEIDLLIDNGLSIALYEIKASKTLRHEMTRGLKLAEAAGVFKEYSSVKSYLLSFHENRIPLDGNVTALPWWEAWA